MPVKPLTFKGDKTQKKKRKRREEDDAGEDLDGKNADGNAQTWILAEAASDLNGPCLIVLPTTPPTCLAADANGNVFASLLENMVDNDPRTAEPHDVQQVWVASRVAGMKESEVNFKGSHGGYLSCDTDGVLGAKREARGHEEIFVVDQDQDADTGRLRYGLRTAASKSSAPNDRRYLTATSESGVKKISVSLRGDGMVDSPEAQIVLRMQARFKPKTDEVKEQARSKEKITRQELERAAGRSLTDEEAKRLKKAKRDGSYYEEILDVRAKGKHDKYA